MRRFRNYCVSLDLVRGRRLVRWSRDRLLVLSRLFRRRHQLEADKFLVSQLSGVAVHQLSPPPTDRILLVASTGGHLTQLTKLVVRRRLDDLWLTFRSPQSESLLAGQRVAYVPYIRPRSVVGVARAVRKAFFVMQAEKFDLCVSTGAGVALAVFPIARLYGVRCLYIESVARTMGPSLTGAIVRKLRFADTFTQHPSWVRPGWRVHSSVLSSFESYKSRVGERKSHGSMRVLVTVGTIQPYRFDSLIDRILSLSLDDVCWQLGESYRPLTCSRVSAYMEPEEFRAECLAADVVVTHAGAGTIIGLLELGVYPVVVPRRQFRGEHVDDHQLGIASLLESLDLATVVEVDELSVETLRRSAGMRVRAVEGLLVDGSDGR